MVDPVLPPSEIGPRRALAPAMSGEVAVGDGLRIRYRHQGDGDVALVLPSDSWLGEDMEALVEGRDAVFYDLRGRGRSSPVHSLESLGLDRDVADLERLRRHLGLRRMILVGWSYHGAVAVRYSLQYPQWVERLVMVGPTAPRQQPFFHGFLDRFSRRVDLDGLVELQKLRRHRTLAHDLRRWSEAVHRLYFRAYVVDDACLEGMRSNPSVEPNLDADRVNNQGRRVLEMLGDFDWQGDFGGFSIPTLIVHGEQDVLMVEGSELWRRILPRSRLLRLEDVGHMPWLEDPGRFFPALEQFLDGRWPGDSR